MATSLIIPDGYGYVILSIYAVTVVYFLIPMIVVNGLRNKIFNKDFMEKNFGEEHKKVFGASAPLGGYPDMGNGRYAEKLTYEEWYKFNNMQRVHYNFLEQLPAVIIFSLISGLFFPIPSAIATGVFAAGRVLYSIGYIVGGPNLRLPGAAAGIISTTFLFGSAGYGIVGFALK